MVVHHPKSLFFPAILGGSMRSPSSIDTVFILAESLRDPAIGQGRRALQPGQALDASLELSANGADECYRRLERLLLGNTTQPQILLVHTATW